MHQEFATRQVMWDEPTAGHLQFGSALPEAAARFAISMSLDRKGLAASALDNQADPATALIPPAIAPGERSGACRACTNDPAAAKSLRDQAALTTVRFGSGSEPGKVIARQVYAVLGINVDAASVPLIGVGRTDQERLSPYEFFQQLDVPSIQQFLDAAAASGDFADRAQQYRLAENQVLRDLPVAPLWWGHGHAVWGERVHDVTATSAHGVELAAISW
jgi:oligopeptide transport system substrate-binding protein